MPYVDNFIKTFPLWKHNHTTLVTERAIGSAMEGFAPSRTLGEIPW